MLAETKGIFRHSLISNRTLFATLLLAGLYFPSSSVDDGWSTSLTRAFFSVCMVFLAILAVRTEVDEGIFLWISCFIVIWLCFCTFLSLLGPLREITLSPLALFSPVAFLFSIRVAKFRCADLTRILAVISIANVFLAIAMLTVEPFQDFMAAYYNNFSSNFSSQLVTDMITANKPVLTFATHSLAGAFVYLFFWLNFRTYQKTRKTLHLVLAVLHVVMCISIMSITSLALSVVAIAELAWNFQWISTLCALGGYFLIPVSVKENVVDALQVAVTYREGGGFQARYVPNGVLANTFSYIHNHPLLPIGLMHSHNLFDEGAQTDSGPILYFLRGSIVLALLMYGGLFLFLRNNLIDKWDCYRLLFVILAAETGFTLLTYSRSFLLIPAFVIYLNSLAESSAEVVPSQSNPKQAEQWI